MGTLVSLCFVSSGFQSQSGQLYSHLAERHTWDSPLMWHLLTSWWPAWRPVAILYIRAKRTCCPDSFTRGIYHWRIYGGAWDKCSLPGVQILLISCSFWEKFHQIIAFRTDLWSCFLLHGEILFFKIFWRTWVLFVGPLIPLFWTSGDVSSGFHFA